MKIFLNKIKYASIKILNTTIILCFIISIYNHSQNTPPFTLKQIIVEGNDYLNQEDIKSLIDKDNKKSISQYDITKIKKNIEKHSFIKSADIKIKNFNNFYIKIEERIPVALIINENKQNFIDIERMLLPVNIKSLNTFPVPLINIKENDSIDKYEEIAFSIIKYILNEYPNMYRNISEIFITESLITIITDNNTSIYVDPNMPIANINKLKEFEKSIKHLKNIDDHKYINLIYEKQIVVKERNSFNHG